MKAAVVLLADYKTQNFARRILFELEQEYQIDYLASLLPAHVSLKQPFSFENMETLENYFDLLATQIAPFKIQLNEIYYAEWSGYGILGVNVNETDTLRKLHVQLNRELSKLFTDTSAPHDGDGYKFHMTIEMGNVKKSNPFRTYYNKIKDKKLNLSFMAEHIALFYYTGEDHLSFINYKVLPLTGRQ